MKTGVWGSSVFTASIASACKVFYELGGRVQLGRVELRGQVPPPSLIRLCEVWTVDDCIQKVYTLQCLLQILLQTKRHCVQGQMVRCVKSVQGCRRMNMMETSRRFLHLFLLQPENTLFQYFPSRCMQTHGNGGLINLDGSSSVSLPALFPLPSWLRERILDTMFRSS